MTKRLVKAYLRERKKEKKKTEREKRRGQTCWSYPHREKERERSEGMALTTTIYGARRLANWPDLALARDRGQWAEARGRVELWI